jgi:c-di-GMP-related signal transduction protein
MIQDAWAALPLDQQTPECERTLYFVELVMLVKSMPVPPQMKMPLLDAVDSIGQLLDLQQHHISHWNATLLELMKALKDQHDTDRLRDMILPAGVKRKPQ